MLAADPDLQVGPGSAPSLDPDLHQFTYALLVQGLEDVKGQDLLLDIEREEPPGVIPAVTKGQLGKVIGAEGEELRVLGNLAGKQSRPRNLDHGPDHILDFCVVLFHDRFRHFNRILLDQLHLAGGPDQRDHNLRHDLLPFLRQFTGRFKNRPDLHFFDVAIARKLMREGPHIAGALNVVLAPQRVDATAFDTDVSADHGQVGTGFDIIDTGGVLRDSHGVKDGGSFCLGVQPCSFDNIFRRHTSDGRDIFRGVFFNNLFECFKAFGALRNIFFVMEVF